MRVVEKAGKAGAWEHTKEVLSGMTSVGWGH